MIIDSKISIDHGLLKRSKHDSKSACLLGKYDTGYNVFGSSCFCSPIKLGHMFWV